MRGLLVLVALAMGFVAGGSAQAQSLPPGCRQQSYESRQAAIARCDDDGDQRAEDVAAQARQARETATLMAELRKRPPLPAAQNRLIGRWQAPARRAARSELDALASLLTAPGAAMCGAMFGGGQVEFTADRWALTDSAGRDDMGPVAYRAAQAGVAVLPAQGVQLLVFEFVGPDRVRAVGQGPDCELTRIGATSAGRTGGPPAAATARPASPGAGFTILGVRLGVDTAGPVERNIKARGGESLPGFLENKGKLRIYSRDGNFGDIDRRTAWTRYDFDGADGAAPLVAVTLGFVREPGGASAIYRDRLAALSAQYGPTLGPPSGPYTARKAGVEVTLVDDPAAQQVLETYALAP